MAVIAFASTKGGSGKTTAAVAVANAFRRAGLTVGLVDGDPPQCRHVAQGTGRRRRRRI